MVREWQSAPSNPEGLTEGRSSPHPCSPVSGQEWNWEDGHPGSCLQALPTSLAVRFWHTPCGPSPQRLSGAGTLSPRTLAFDPNPFIQGLGSQGCALRTREGGTCCVYVH